VVVKFDSIDQAASFKPPKWFGREVTNDLQYGSLSLMDNGFPDESKINVDWVTKI